MEKETGKVYAVLGDSQYFCRLYTGRRCVLPWLGAGSYRSERAGGYLVDAGHPWEEWCGWRK